MQPQHTNAKTNTNTNTTTSKRKRKTTIFLSILYVSVWGSGGITQQMYDTIQRTDCIIGRNAFMFTFPFHYGAMSNNIIGDCPLPCSLNFALCVFSLFMLSLFPLGNTWADKKKQPHENNNHEFRSNIIVHTPRNVKERQDVECDFVSFHSILR